MFLPITAWNLLCYRRLFALPTPRGVALAHQNRNLADFVKALRDFKHGMLGSVHTMHR
jgi:hypothetical protein